MPSLTEAKANAELARLKAELATAEAVELAKREKIAAVARTLTYEMARKIVESHIRFPEYVHYDEVILFAALKRLAPILLSGCVFYLGFTGEFSSAKTYATEVVLMLGEGRFIVDPTDRAIVRYLMDNPNDLIGIDEVDELVKKHPYTESLLRMGNKKGVFEPLNIPDGNGGWQQVMVDIGGPKVFNGYEGLEKALASRTLGSPDLLTVREWLRLRCESAMEEWDEASVTARMRSEDFQSKVRELTEKSTIPRDQEVVTTILLLGEILDIDTSKIVAHYKETSNVLTQKAEIYKDVLGEVYADLEKWGIQVAEKNLGETLPDSVTRRNKSRQLEIQSTELLDKMNTKLFDKTREQISTGQWRHVLAELGFVRDKNWNKERGRNAWRNKYYVVFDEDILKLLGKDGECS